MVTTANLQLVVLWMIAKIAVLGENLEDLHHPPTTTRNWIVHVLLDELREEGGGRRLRRPEHLAKTTG